MQYDELKKAVSACPEFRAHNLDMSTEEVRQSCATQPVRAAEQADFGAEAHGFTGFERAGKGSRFNSSRRKPGLLRALFSRKNR